MRQNLASAALGAICVGLTKARDGVHESRGRELRKCRPLYAQVAHDGALEALGAAEAALEGDVSWILVSFPTPFASEGGGNARLPPREAFMGNRRLLEAALSCAKARGGGATLLVQSNAEDVAVAMRAMAEDAGWVPVLDGSLGAYVCDDDVPGWRPERQRAHALGGGRRALGPGWLRGSPLPPGAATETERYYASEGLPIHRVAFRLPDPAATCSAEKS